MTRPASSRRSLLRDHMLARCHVIVMPLWAMYHGDGDRLVSELDALGEESYLLMQSGPLFGDATTFEAESEN